MLPLIFPACQSKNKVWFTRSVPPGKYPPTMLGSLRRGNDELSEKNEKLQKEIKLLKSHKDIASSVTKLMEKDQVIEQKQKINDTLSRELSNKKDRITMLQTLQERREKDFDDLRSELGSAKDEISTLEKRNVELKDTVKNMRSADSISSPEPDSQEAIQSEKMVEESGLIIEDLQQAEVLSPQPDPQEAVEAGETVEEVEIIAESVKSESINEQTSETVETVEPVEDLQQTVALSPEPESQEDVEAGETVEEPVTTAESIESESINEQTSETVDRDTKQLQQVAQKQEVLPAAPDEGTIKELVDNWKTAWEKKDTKTYFDFYSSRFKDKGMDFESWKKYKLDVFQSKKNIKINISDVVTQPKNNRDIIVSFLQYYNADSYSDVGIKTLHWHMESDRWKIVLERWELTTQASKAILGISEGKVVQELISRWKTAWESRDIETYLSFYSHRIKVREMNFDSWSKHKSGIFQSKANISVKISNIKTSKRRNGDVVAKFLQHYSTDSYSDVGIKTLRWRMEIDGWKIFREYWNSKS